MITRQFICNPKVPLLALCVSFAGALLCPSAQAQLWDMLTKPQITVNLTHPPRLGLNIKKVAFGPSYGECSDEIVDRLTQTLVSGGVEVIDHHRLHYMLDQQHLGFNGSMDRQSAMRMGTVLGPTALVFVKISQCSVEPHRNTNEHKERKKDSNGGQHDEIERSYDAIVDMHLRGTLQTVDLATGRIFSAAPIVQDAQLINHSDKEPPEFPAAQAVRDIAIGHAVYDASTMLLPWTEEKKLYFFNDKECNLNAAFSLLKANDFQGVVRQSEENIEACKTWPKLKDNSVAHAYYNAGLAYLLVNDHEKALYYLTESEKLKGGQIVTDTIAEANKSAQLEAEMRRVNEQTERFEQESMENAAPPAANYAPQPPPNNAPPASAEERLKKLDSLYRQGLITKQEYDAKKSEILKDL
jgi:hypothetical protein